MTPDQIRNLKPGPELDRAVAVTLFGITPTMDISQPGDLAHISNERYSTTWAGLGLVVEEMERRGWGYGSTSYPWRAKHDAHHAHMAEFYDQHGELAAEHSSTIFEAACKAALLALAAEKGIKP
jgi:hypothetical protein